MALEERATKQNKDRFYDLTDEEIVSLAQTEHNQEATEYIVQKYRNFVKAKARSYFLIGADKEDIIQEGMIGLYKTSAVINKRPSGPLQTCA